ncbi:MAG: glycosyltransferase family 2 protein [Myxococcota bacterium]
MSEEGGSAPKVSFAVPIRNGGQFLPRLLASLRAQDFTDFEVVICDNDSSDETLEIARSVAECDARVRVFQNDRNIGQVANFNRVVDLARGRYLRWIGCDDWLEPSYARRCVEALDQSPEAIGVTTYQDHIDDEGTRHYAEYTGPRLQSSRPEDRFCRMMWFLNADYRYIDPIYSMLRRDAVLRTRRLLLVPSMDQVLAAELALLGPFLHIPECLAHRRLEVVQELEELQRRYHPASPEALDPTRLLAKTVPAMWEPLSRVPMGPVPRTVCALTLIRYGILASLYCLEPRLRRSARLALNRLAQPRGSTQAW